MHMESNLNTYKWLEADKLFLKSVMIAGFMEDIDGQRPMVLPYNADLIRARQLYLRSYPFTRPEKKSRTRKTKLFLIKEKNYLQMKIATLASLFRLHEEDQK